MTDEYDVEIIGPAPANPLVAPLVEPLKKSDQDNRSLVELDRRDWIMLGVGGGIVGGALLLGFGLSRRMRPKPVLPAADETPDPSTLPAAQPVKPPEAADPKKDGPKKEQSNIDEMKKEDAKKEQPNTKPKSE
jgi:hypothetical protein